MTVRTRLREVLAGGWLGLTAAVTTTRRFLAYLNQEFSADRGLQVTAELAYTSLLSLVPLMAVAFGLLAAFPVFESISARIQDFVFSNFVPAASDVVQRNLQTFAGNASRLTGVGVGFLVVTALMMMSTIDHSFNHIWKVRVKRSPFASFTVYWAVLTLGPVLMGLSLILTSYLASLPFLHDAADRFVGAKRILLWMPFLTAWLAFVLLYVIVPNRNVPLRHALIGGLVAAFLFELAKRGFALYVTQFPTYQNIYGAMAAIPIFLIWIYVSWLIAVLGAEFTHCLSSFRGDAGEGVHGWQESGFLWAYRLLGHLWVAQRQGRVLSVKRLLHKESRVSETVLLDVIETLRRAGLVYRPNSGDVLLCRDLGEMSLLDLYRALPFALRLPEQERDAWDRALREALEQAFDDLRLSMNAPIKQFYGGADGGKAVSEGLD